MNLKQKGKPLLVPRHKRSFYVFYAITAISIIALSLVL